jgi:hypothetical protein
LLAKAVVAERLLGDAGRVEDCVALLPAAFALHVLEFFADWWKTAEVGVDDAS